MKDTSFIIGSSLVWSSQATESARIDAKWGAKIVVNIWLRITQNNNTVADVKLKLDRWYWVGPKWHHLTQYTRRGHPPSYGHISTFWLYLVKDGGCECYTFLYIWLYFVHWFQISICTYHAIRIFFYIFFTKKYRHQIGHSFIIHDVSITNLTLYMSIFIEKRHCAYRFIKCGFALKNVCVEEKGDGFVFLIGVKGWGEGYTN